MSTVKPDMVAVDKLELQAWVDAGRPADRVPPIETYITKSRNFEKMRGEHGLKAIEEQVQDDMNELLDNYSGRLEISQTRPESQLNVMRGFTAEVKKMHLVYNDRCDLITSSVRQLIKETVKRAADGNPVEVQFLQ